MADFPINLTGRHAGPDTLRALMQGRIPWAFAPVFWYRQRIRLTDFTPTAGTSQTLTLNSLFAKNVFPSNVDLEEGALVRNISLPTGTPTGLTITVGGTYGVGVDADGHVTVSNLLGGGAAAGDIINTPAAARYARRPESAFSPTITLASSGGNLNTFTAIDIEILIPWSPRTQVS